MPDIAVQSYEPNSEDAINAAVMCAQYGHSEELKRLVDNRYIGANMVDKDGCALLHWAAINNRLSVVEYLLAQGADPNVHGGVLDETPVQWAIRKNLLRMVHLFLERGADIAHRDVDGLDCLGLAVKLGFMHLAFMLLCRGADPDKRDADQMTPLMTVCKSTPRDMDMIRLLLRFGAQPKLAGPSEESGRTALHMLVAHGGSYDGVCTLIAAGADVLARDSKGLTPLGITWQGTNSHLKRPLMDFHVKAYIPCVEPLAVAFSAASTLTLPLAVEYLGWPIGIIVWCLVHFFVFQPAALGYLPSMEKRQACIFAGSAIILIVVSHHLFITPYASSGATFFAVMMEAATALTFAGAIFNPPISITPSKSSSDRSQLIDKMLSNLSQEDGPQAAASSEPHAALKLCTTCITDKTLSSMHCSRCNKCVVSLDHHCPFVANCVAAGNRRIFITFLMCAVIGIGHFVIEDLYTGIPHACGTDTVVGALVCLIMDQRGLCVVTFIGIILWIWIFCLFIGQVYMVAEGTTTYDMMKGLNVEGLSLGEKCNHLIKFVVTGEAVRLCSKMARPSRRCCDHDHDGGHGGHNHGQQQYRGGRRTSGGGEFELPSRDRHDHHEHDEEDLEAGLAPLLRTTPTSSSSSSSSTLSPHSSSLSSTLSATSSSSSKLVKQQGVGLADDDDSTSYSDSSRSDGKQRTV